MGILDKLVEKKDIEMYCNVRTAQLVEDMRKAIDDAPASKKQYIVEKFSGRISELRVLKGVAHGNHFKAISKKHFNVFLESNTSASVEYRKMARTRKKERDYTNEARG